MTTYTKHTKGNPRKNTGTMTKTSKINRYHLFVGILGLVDYLIIYFGLQHLGGEQIHNGVLFILAAAISVSMAFSAHYAGETIRRRSKKASIITIALGIIFLFIVGYLRAVSGGSFVLTLTNLGLYGTIAYVSFLRAEHQPYFGMMQKIQALSAEDARIQSGIETKRNSVKHLKDSKAAKNKKDAADKVKSQFNLINDSILHADQIVAQADGYIARCTQEIEDIKQASLSNCRRLNPNSNQ